MSKFKAFFPKSGQFFRFQKRTGKTPPLPPMLVSPLNYFCVNCVNLNCVKDNVYI